MQAFEGLNSNKFDVTKFICDYIARKQASAQKEVPLSAYLEQLEYDAEYAYKQMDFDLRVDKTKSAKQQAEVMVQVSRITSEIYDLYSYYLKLQAQTQIIKVDSYQFERRAECNAVYAEINLKQLYETFANALLERKYLEAASLLCVVYNILQQPFAVHFSGLLSFFSQCRDELRAAIISDLNFDFDVVYEPIQANCAGDVMLVDSHVRLFTKMVDCAGNQNDSQIEDESTLTLLEVQIYVAFQLDFVEDILDGLALHPSPPDFYADVPSVKNYVENLFLDFRGVLRRVHRISQVSQKFGLQSGNRRAIQLILRNFAAVRAQIGLVIRKFIDQCRTEQLAVCDLQVFGVCVDLLYKNQQFLRQQGYYIGCDDKELDALLAGLERFIVDAALIRQQGYCAHEFQTKFVLESRYALLDTAFSRNHTPRVTEFQHCLLHNISNLAYTLQQLQDFGIAALLRFLRRVLTIRYVYFQENPVERFVDLIYYYAVMLKFVTPECFGMLTTRVGGYNCSQLETEQRACHAANCEHFDLMTAQLVLEINKTAGEKAVKLKRFREYCSDRKYDLYMREMEAFAAQYLL